MYWIKYIRLFTCRISCYMSKCILSK